MSVDVHKTVETIFNGVKILAIIVAGAWTYYQWDKVFFPEAAAEQEARASGDRVDLEMTVEEVRLNSFGSPYVTDGDISEDGADDPKADRYFVELAGLITIRNNRSFPIHLDVTSVDLSVAYGFEKSEESDLYALSLQDEASVSLDSQAVFGEVIDDGLTLESDGVARLVFRAPLVISNRVVSEPHEYRFTSVFELSEVSVRKGEIQNSNVKTKRAMASAFVNGPAEAIQQMDATGREIAQAVKAATGISIRDIQTGGILGGNNSLLRKLEIPF